MEADRASRTAEHNALFRAMETARPTAARPMRDPLAREFLRPPLRFVAALATVPGIDRGVKRVIDGRWPGVRTSVVARTRLIDDTVVESVTGHRRQVVLLGAGYDTRAYRLGPLRSLDVFEVDHPATQAAKRRILERTLDAIPANVRFVPTDFNLGTLDSAMAASGFEPSTPSLFLWEGVTNYLTEEAVDMTFRWLAEACEGSVVIFTYIEPYVMSDPQRYAGAERLMSTLARAGEQLTFGLEATETRDYLHERGLQLDRDLGAADYRRLYFADAAQHMVGHEFYRVAIATVSGGGSDSVAGA